MLLLVGESLINSVQRVGRFVEGSKTVPVVMFDIQENSLRICYTDGKKAIIDVIDIVNDDKYTGKLIVPYSVLMKIIDGMKAKGPVYVNDVQMSVNESKKCIDFSMDKWINMESGEGSLDECVIKIKQSLGYYDPDNVKYSILSRINYDDILDMADKFEWNKGEFIRAASICSTEKGRTVYIARSNARMFVSNVSSSISIQTEELPINSGVALPTNLTKDLISILEKTEGDRVFAEVKEGKYLVITSESMKTGIWVEMVPANRIDLDTLQKCYDREYDDMEILVSRHVFSSLLEYLKNLGINSRIELTIEEDEDDYVVKISNLGTNGSMVGDYAMQLGKFACSEETDRKLSINVNIMYDLIDKCGGDYVVIRAENIEESSYLFVGSLDDIDDEGNIVSKIVGYATIGR